MVYIDARNYISILKESIMHISKYIYKIYRYIKIEIYRWFVLKNYLLCNF